MEGAPNKNNVDDLTMGQVTKGMHNVNVPYVVLTTIKHMYIQPFIMGLD